jgi:hypothetical protein
MVMLGLGGNSEDEDVEDDEEGDTELRDDHLLVVGISGMDDSAP